MTVQGHALPFWRLRTHGSCTPRKAAGIAAAPKTSAMCPEAIVPKCCVQSPTNDLGAVTMMQN
jgi:hypothetical protein